MIYWRVGCVMANWMCGFSAAQSRRREKQHCAGSQTSRSRPGAVLEISSKLMKAKVFFKKVASMYLLWKNSCQKGLQVAKYRAKVALVTRELMAAGGWYWGGPPQINERMGNTGDCLWECRQFSSTQNELYETSRARFSTSLYIMDGFIFSAKKNENKIVRW